MPLTNVLSAQVLPEHLRRFIELVPQPAKRAVEKKERFHWTHISPMKSLHAIAPLLLALSTPAFAEIGSAAATCFEQTRPEPDSVRAIRLTARDREGQKTIVVMRMYGRRGAEGLGQLFMRFDQPAEIRGTAVLALERKEGDSEVYLASPDLPTPRRITGPPRADGMFRTDFSSEDLQRLQQGWRPGAGELKQLPDEVVAERLVYVLEVRPTDSAYERIVFCLDQESCLPLRIRFYVPGRDKPRKELTTDPRSNLKHGNQWVAHSALIRDLENDTSTHLMVDSQDELLPDGQFTVEALERAVREGMEAP